MGVPISAMQPVVTLNSTDNFVISQGPNLGDNKRIEWQNLIALIQTFGQSQTIVQTLPYTNNNTTADVVPSFNLVLTSGKWDIFLDCSIQGNGVQGDSSYYISYNTNPLIVNQDPSDIILSGSVRESRFPANGGLTLSSTGISLVVPSASSYIVKIVSYETAGVSYTLNDRVLKAIKTL